ncbi:MAG: hypothetical protein AB7U98_11740 [Candidatus Nitrosocosmicus sp.]
MGPIADTKDKIDSEIFFSRKLESNWNLGNQSSYSKNGDYDINQQFDL